MKSMRAVMYPGDGVERWRGGVAGSLFPRLECVDQERGTVRFVIAESKDANLYPFRLCGWPACASKAGGLHVGSIW
ncbi:MAG: hypothetical protein DRI39_09970 [Chloroflexi bacterium]|nr:MAG: hypothetical protein DRI39_09970 [Chloroflexota bacterium]